MTGRAETSAEGAPPAAAPTGPNTLREGRFELRFRDDAAAKAAARDARAVGFVVAVHVHDGGGWLVVGRRKNAFPADDGHRYASRLRSIAEVHGGEYDRFVTDS